MPRFLLALTASAAVILSAPFNREIRDWIRRNFPGHFVLVVASVIALLIAAAIVIAVLRIRDRRAMRYSAIGAALILGVVYSLANAQGIAEVDTVERFHFVEYGLITLLFYRAWRPIGDASLFVLPVLAGLLVGTAEEWLQWFIPGRIGDMRDVFLNGASIVCGLLFSLGLDPPDKLSLAFNRGSIRRIGIVACSVALVFAAFVFTVHAGVENHDADAGTFRSRYDMTTLLALSQDRAVRWKETPPVARPSSLSREDQYQNEGHLHVRERNRLWDAGDIRGAWQENLILERFFAPVLDAPSFLSKSGHRWPAAQRSDAEQRVSAAPDAQRSDAERRSSAAPVAALAAYSSLADVAEGRHFIRPWPPITFWSVVLMLTAALAGVTFAFDRRR